MSTKLSTWFMEAPYVVNLSTRVECGKKYSKDCQRYLRMALKVPFQASKHIVYLFQNIFTDIESHSYVVLG